MKSWSKDRIAAENYNATTGEAMDQGDTDPFYIWAAMLPLMTVGEIIDFDPWSGWTLHNAGTDLSVGPMLSPSGMLSVSIADGLLEMSLDGRASLKTNLQTSFTQITVSDARFSCTITPAGSDGFVTLPNVEPDRIVAARLDGQEVRFEASTDGARLEMARAAHGRKLDVYFLTV
jgi:putative isomerase